MTNAPRPGWYPDPAGASDAYRWWDGDSWTDHLSESPNAPAPEPSTVTTAPRRRSPLTTIVALILVVALFLSAGVWVGLWLWDAGGAQRSGRPQTPDRTSAPRSTTLASPSEPPGQLDEPTRTARIGTASMQLPADPYELHSDPVVIPGVLDAAFLAEAEVHERYDGEHDWSAMVALAAVNPAVAAQPDLEGAGKATLARLAAVLYGKQVTKVTRPHVADRAIDNHPGVEFTAQVHYAVDRLPSRYDTVRAVVVKLDDGTVVAAISSVPDDAAPDVTRLAAQSLDSLSIE